MGARNISSRVTQSVALSTLINATAAIRIDYAAEYLESQGYLIFYNYFNEMLLGLFGLLVLVDIYIEYRALRRWLSRPM